MQLRPEQLADHVARHLGTVYTVHGDEPLRAQECADAVRAAMRQAGATERKVFVVSGAWFDWSGVLGAAQSMGLFADQQLIEIRIPSGKPGKEGGEALQQLAREATPESRLLVHLPKLDWQQQKSAWFQALDGAGITVAAEPIERPALPAWLAKRLAAQDQRVEAGPAGEKTLAFMADRVEGNLLAAHQEIQKLGLLYPTGELTFAQMEEAVLDVARHDVARLCDAVLALQVPRALRMLDGLQAEGETAVFVHYRLADDIRALKRVQEALADGKPLPMALREARIWGARERLFERALPRLRPAVATRLVEAASECDGVLKGLRHPAWPAAPWEALRRLVLMTLQALRPEGARSGIVLRA
ncbi:MAG TPA: DNA polymerase III subunit delta [Burkholderiaceae bacterium]|nr:DNA polymerase III subunit delta [Burkholderiaceae bacterium]